MKRFSWLSTLCAVGLGGSALLGTARAGAQECSSDADCEAGLTCVSAGVAEDCARPAIECAEGEECPEPAPCEQREYKYCALPPCETDDDCPSGTVCHTYTWESCADEGTDSGGAEPAPACAPGEECVQPEDPACETPECKEAQAAEREASCEPTTEMSEPQCVPVWQLPCTESADCGAGFTCEERISMWCDGSGPAMGGGSDGDPGAGAGDAIPAPESEPACGSTPTGEFRCEMVETECASDGDCEAGWSCADNPSRPVCGGAEGGSTPPEGDDGSSGFAPPPDMPAEPPAGDPVDSCGDSTVPVKVCLPPFYGASDGVARGDLATTGAESGGDQDSAPGEPPVADGNDGEDGDDNEESDSGMEAESDSCAVQAPGANGGSWALSLLGLFGAVALLRRRAHKA